MQVEIVKINTESKKHGSVSYVVKAAIPGTNAVLTTDKMDQTKASKVYLSVCEAIKLVVSEHMSDGDKV